MHVKYMPNFKQHWALPDHVNRLTVLVACWRLSPALREQSAEPRCLHLSEAEAPEAQGAVGAVQAQTPEQERDHGVLTPPDTHAQSSTQLLLMNTCRNQQLQQGQRSPPITHLNKHSNIFFSARNDNEDPVIMSVKLS